MSGLWRTSPSFAPSVTATSRASRISTASQKSTQIQIVKKKIQSFEDIAPIRQSCSSIYLQHNQICDFVGLPDLPRLTRLDLDGNPVHSFEGCRHLPNLRFLSLCGTLLSRSKYLKLMALVAFGDQLIKVNNEPIPMDTRGDAAVLGEALFPLLHDGKILTNLKPLRVADPKERTLCAPGEHLLAASRLVGYTTPLVDKQNKEWLQKRLPGSLPSLAASWYSIIVNKEVANLPQSFTSRMYEDLLDLKDELDEGRLKRAHKSKNESEGSPMVAKRSIVEAHRIFASDAYDSESEEEDGKQNKEREVPVTRPVGLPPTEEENEEEEEIGGEESGHDLPE
jgi:hypothetical protein